MNRKLIAVVSASAFLGAALMPIPAAAQELATMRVAKADLNLSSDQGARAMLKRIRTASARFCGDAYSPGAAQRRAARACQAAMAQRAVGALDAPVVTAMYQATDTGAAVLLASR